MRDGQGAGDAGNSWSKIANRLQPGVVPTDYDIFLGKTNLADAQEEQGRPEQALTIERFPKLQRHRLPGSWVDHPGKDDGYVGLLLNLLKLADGLILGNTPPDAICAGQTSWVGTVKIRDNETNVNKLSEKKELFLCLRS